MDELFGGIDDWFRDEVLPLEPIFTNFLARRLRDQTSVADVRQEVYLRVYEAAKRQRPVSAKRFLFQTARNLLIDQLRRTNVVSIETVADFDDLNVLDHDPSPEEHVAAIQELHLLQEILDDLPQRCREVVMLRRVQGLSQREVACRMNISEDTVEKQIAKATKYLALSDLGSRYGRKVAAMRSRRSRKLKL